MKYKRQLAFKLIILLSLLLSSVMLCYAEPADDYDITAERHVELFDGRAELIVREGCEFLDAAAYYDYWDYSGDYDFEDFVYVFPVADDENWEMYIYYNDIGHLDGPYELNGKMILQRYFDQYDGNVDYYSEPVYDPEKSKWSWCVRIENSGASPYFVYQELFLMREGCISAYLYFSPQNLDAGLMEYIESAIAVLPGSGYEDFDPSSDSVCGFDYIGAYLYGDTGSDFQELQYSAGDVLSGGRFSSFGRNIVYIFIIAIAVLLRLKAGRKPKTAKKRAPAKPFRLRKTYDEEDRTDSGSYYRKLREEEERLARRHD